MVPGLRIPKSILSLNDDELFELCSANSELVIERNNKGDLIIMSPSGSKTGNRNLRIAGALLYWNDQTNLGYAFDSSAGFRLPDGSMFSPDCAWIEKSRWEQLSAEEQEKFAPLCPDFIVEIKSPSDSIKYLKEKMILWINNGCKLGWLIDPEEKKTYVYRADGSIQISDFEHSLSGENVLPGFNFDLKKLP